MSVMGSGTAAAVAQTALQAQQTARQRDKRTRESQHILEKHRLKADEVDLKVTEEHDDGEASPRLMVDGQMQDEHPPHAMPDDTDAEGVPRAHVDVRA